MKEGSIVEIPANILLANLLPSVLRCDFHLVWEEKQHFVVFLSVRTESHCHPASAAAASTVLTLRDASDFLLEFLMVSCVVKL